MNTEEVVKVGDTLEVIEGYQASDGEWVLIPGEIVKVTAIGNGTRHGSNLLGIDWIADRPIRSKWRTARWNPARFEKVQPIDEEIMTDSPTPIDEEMKMDSRTILEEAADLVSGDRRDDYGDAVESFERIAQAWSAAVFDRPVTAVQVATAMAVLKLCRFRTSQDRDSLVDLAGYAALAAEIKGL